MRTLLIHICIAQVLLSSAGAVRAIESPEGKRKLVHRRYDQGPVQVREFEMKPPDSLPGRAYTATRVLYNYRFLSRQIRTNRFEARLQSIETFAVFLKDESWWNSFADRRLLDHEQGHFDIAEIAARRLRLSFLKSSEGRKRIVGVGPTEEAANQVLNAKLKKMADVANKQAIEENAAYDKRTHHGVATSNQAEHRRVQRLTLEKLRKEIDKYVKKLKSSDGR